MPPFSEIVAYTPFSIDDLQSHLSAFGGILENLGFDKTHVNLWLSSNSELLPKDEWMPSWEWEPIRLNGVNYRARKYIMSWGPATFPQLDQLWLQLGLYFEFHDLVDPAKDYVEPGAFFLPEVPKAIWRIMREFASPFGRSGVYFIDETSDYPWEVMLTGKGSLWQFNMALIPKVLRGRFEPVPATIQRFDLEYGTALISLGNAKWPIIWPECLGAKRSMNIAIPEFSMVVLIGASGSGKSTFARTLFKPTEIISSDACRALVSDDENDLSATEDAFDVLHFIASKRLAAKRLVVVDATNVQPEARKPLVELAREHDTMPIAIVLNMPEALCRGRNALRSDRADMKPHVIKRHVNDLRRSLGRLEKEGFRKVFVMRSLEEVEAASITREPMWTDKSVERGPFDIIGDIHGCYDELTELLAKLGYSIDATDAQITVTPPDGRKVVFLGDYVDRGPNPVGVLKLVMSMVKSGTAIALPGNHDIKLQRALNGKNVQRMYGLAETMEQFEALTKEDRDEAAHFIDKLISHFLLDDGKLIVAHAGMKERYAGRASGRVRDFALYGETTGETDDFGLPVRMNWAAEYRGKAVVVYGHTPVPRAEWLNNTINIDTGCCFGGAISALRYPERELVSVPAHKVYADPVRPLSANSSTLSGQQQVDDLLNIADYIGKRIIETELSPQIVIREENSIAALEVMSRFAVNPKWLIYLPPTMSPCATSQRPDLLEHPEEAFGYYRSEGIAQVVCEEKHMGSRAVLIICRDEDTAMKRFGVINEGIGVCYTRTGRRFFDDLELESAFLARVRDAITGADLWQTLNTDWVCLDAELMPWSAKAQGLLESQYAAVGAAARAALGETTRSLEMAALNGIEVAPLLDRVKDRVAMVDQYADAYRRYCWPVQSLNDLKLAPFHLLASEGAVHIDKDHVWHMEMLAHLCQADTGLLLATPFKVIDINDPESVSAGAVWWQELTAQGGEGMVVKPKTFIAKNSKGFAQPAVKVRGREYLRIIYGPEYTAPDQIERLRSRGLGRKRGMAAREFALGVEALQRFVQNEPLRRVHECVFSVLALESEPVDPRL